MSALNAAVTLPCRGRDGRDVPVALEALEAVGRPQEVLAHADMAGEERVAVGVDVRALEGRPVHRHVVGPDRVVEVLPAGAPRVGDLGGLAVARRQAAGPEVGTQTAHVVALQLEAPLGQVLGIEPVLGRVLARLVDGQDLADLAGRVVVPGALRAVGHRVLLAVLVGRLGEAGLLEQALRVEQDRRIDGERDADLAFIELVDVDRVLGEAREVVVRLLDVRGEVQPLAVERVRAADAHRAHDVGAVARRDLDAEGVVGARVRHRLERQVDVRMTRIELLRHGLFHGHLFGRVAATEAAVPADLHLAGLCRAAAGGDRRGDRRPGRAGGCRRAGRGPCRGAGRGPGRRGRCRAAARRDHEREGRDRRRDPGRSEAHPGTSLRSARPVIRARRCSGRDLRRDHLLLPGHRAAPTGRDRGTTFRMRSSCPDRTTTRSMR